MRMTWSNIRRCLLPQRLPSRRTMIVLAVLAACSVLAHGPILRLLAWPLLAEAADCGRPTSTACMGTSWAPTVSSRSITPPPGMRKPAGRKILLLLPRTAASWRSAPCGRSSRCAARNLASGGSRRPTWSRSAPTARDVWGEAHAMRRLVDRNTPTRPWRLAAVRSAAAGCGMCSTRVLGRPTPRGCG